MIGGEWRVSGARPCFHSWLRAGSTDAGPSWWCPWCNRLTWKPTPPEKPAGERASDARLCQGWVAEYAVSLASGPIFYPSWLQEQFDSVARERGAGAPLVHPATVPAPRSTP